MSRYSIYIRNIRRKNSQGRMRNNVRLLLKKTITLTLLILVSWSILARQDEQETTTTDLATAKKPSESQSTKKKVIVIPPPISLEQQHKSDLKRYISVKTITPILVGPDDVMTLVTKNTTANTKGVAILFPDWQQGAVSPKAINFLRQTLPKQGWTTISVQPPNKPQNFPSTALTEKAQQQENKLSLTDYKIKLSAINKALFAKAKVLPGIVIVIAQGNNGALLVEVYDQADDKPSALILLSSYRLTNHALLDESNHAFAQQIAMSDYPILDLYLKNDHPIVHNKAAERLALAQQEMKVYYRQRQLNNTATSFYPKQELLSQINSWLKSIGW